MHQFSNLSEVLEYYKSEDKCRDTIEKMRWPDGNIICPKCGEGHAYRNSDMRTYKCHSQACKNAFSVTVGTVFQSTKLPLSKWFAAIYFVINRKKGISSHQIARDLGIGQKAAWFMLCRIREMLRNKTVELLDNIVEVDECYVGGRLDVMHRGRRKKIQDSKRDNKTAVMGLIERDGKARLKVIGKETFKDLVRQHVDENAVIVTDSHLGYKGLAYEFVGHATVDHSKQQYKDGIFHTNTVEGAFSHFKRMIVGTQHSISPKHLHRYCDEFSYRWNNRKVKDTERFMQSLKLTEGRLTWKQLTAKSKWER
jgi:transposase-like protein